MSSSTIFCKAIFTLLLPALYPKSDSSSTSEKKIGRSTKMHRMPSTWGRSCLLSLGLLHDQFWNLNPVFIVKIKAFFTFLRPLVMAILAKFAGCAVSIAALSSPSLLEVAVVAASYKLWAASSSVRSFSNDGECSLIESLIFSIADCAVVSST